MLRSPEDIMCVRDEALNREKPRSTFFAADRGYRRPCYGITTITRSQLDGPQPHHRRETRPADWGTVRQDYILWQCMTVAGA